MSINDIPEKILPFFDRFKHPVIKHASFLFFTFNFDVIYPLLMATIYPKYYEQMDEVKNVVNTIEEEFCLRILLPWFLGFVIAAILPVIDAGYRWFGAYIDRIRENWVSKEEEEIYQRKINLLNSKLASVIDLIEIPSLRSILRNIGDDSIIYLFPCEPGMTEATWVKYDSNKRKIYPATVWDSKLLGVVLTVINGNTALILNKGTISDSSLIRITEDGGYHISDNGSLVKSRDEGEHFIQKKDNLVKISGNSNLSVAKFFDREK
ncbi:hypothetical protein [Leptospira hartskeerlii]|uniref:hypothetical protein n=1 Tax=Leptospira hartskeerlii TaxID=2023177 RepID=UPI001A9C8B2A|nr:hypothetical protein [Leptospira hartskeerlii]